MVGLRISEKILRGILIVLILLSIVFSYNIWLAPTNRTPNVNSNTQTINNLEQNYAKATDSYLPIRGIWDLDGQKFQTNSENLLATAQARLTEADYGELSIVAQGEAEMQNYYQVNRGMELNYEGQFSLAEYLKVFDIPINIDNFDQPNRIRFNKIQIDFENNHIRFLNYARQTVYQGDITFSTNTLQDIYENNQSRFIPMTEENQIIPRLLQTEGNIRLKRYNYILTTQSYSLFRNAFFREPVGAKGQENEQGVQSFVSGQEELILNDDQRTVDFSGELPKDVQSDSIYAQTFGYVSRLGTGVGNLRYFDREGGQITYRTFVEGYPIFSESDKGKMVVTIGDAQNDEAKSVAIQMSMDTVQVPIPSDEEIELSSSLEMENQLVYAGLDIDKVESYIIGYTWSDVDGANRLVSLTPEWYVKYDGNWFAASQLMASVTEVSNGF